MTMLKKLALTGATAALVFGALPVLAANFHANVNADVEGNAKVKMHRPMPNVSINGNGMVMVNGATVTAVSGNTISASTKLGDVTLNWTVNANGDTRFNGQGNARTLADLMVGDRANFHGTLTGNLTVQAAAVIDLTRPTPSPRPSPKPEIRSTLEGKIVTTSPLAIRVDDVNYTINVASDTSILNVLWLHTALGNLRVGDELRVFGSVNTTDHTINATVIRDTSIRL